MKLTTFEKPLKFPIITSSLGDLIFYFFLKGINMDVYLAT